MPKNCSSDVQAVIAYLDQIYAENNTAAIQSLKEAFGLGGLSHVDDFAAARQSPIHLWHMAVTERVHQVQNNLYDWQLLQPDVGPGAEFFKFCDALEVKDGVNAPATGWGLENAVQSWGSFWNNTYYAHCKSSESRGTDDDII